MKTLRQTINDIKRLFGTDVQYHLKVNYHYLSGFLVLNSGTPQERFIYISSNDERFNPNYRKNLLIRTAKSLNDFTGGHNNFFNIDDENTTAQSLLYRIGLYGERGGY